MKAREALRAATAAEHERVDRLFSTLNLAEEADYRRFLEAQAGPFLSVEAALERARTEMLVPDWIERRRGHLLAADLAELGIGLPPIEHVEFAGPAAQLGAVYVLEGSRLGGAILKRAVPAALPQRFIGARQRPGAWRKLLEIFDEHLYAGNRLDEAIGAARAVFERFEAAGRHSVETIAA